MFPSHSFYESLSSNSEFKPRGLLGEGIVNSQHVALNRNVANSDLVDSDLSAQDALTDGGKPDLAKLSQTWLTAANSLSHHQAMQVAPAALAYIGDFFFY